VDLVFELSSGSEGLIGEVVPCETAPTGPDVIEFGGVAGQPLDGEPILPRRQSLARDVRGVDRPIVEEPDDGFGLAARAGA
jgi:hypothetical protein